MTSARRIGASSGDRRRAAVALFAVAYVAAVARAVVWDRLATYPMAFPDSYDWLTNGLFYAGVPLETSWRFVVNPLLYGAFFRLGLDDVIPRLGPLYLLGLVAALLTVGRRVLGEAALFAAVLAVTNHFVLANALAIGSDTLALALSTTALLIACDAAERDGHGYALAAVLLVLSFLAQPDAQLLLPAMLVVYLWRPTTGWRGAPATLAQAWRDRSLWIAAAAAITTLAIVVLLRWLVCGAWLPHTAVQHDQLMSMSLANLPYYLWSCVAWWSIPTALLAAAGVVVGLRRRRRATQGLLVAIATQVFFFGVIYSWRDNRFVLYWTFPALLLAGSAIAALPSRARWLVLGFAAWAGNLTTLPDPSPDRTAIVWAPHRAVALNAFTGAVARDPAPVADFHTSVAAWSAARHATFADPTQDDAYYSREGEAVAALAAQHAAPDETVYFHVGPDEPEFRPYMLRNQLILAARRDVRLLSLDPSPAAPPPPAHAVTILRRSEYDRLSAAGMHFDSLAIRPLYCLVRLRPSA